MKWKKFKKERISLNYTVMLLPHSQKKPIHFKTPVWTFGVFFLAILVLSGTCLFFAGSRHQLQRVREEKEQLEQEWEELAAQKQLADQENEALKEAREVQEQELKALKQKTRDTIQELEDLVERENQIRQELGLQQVEGDLAGQESGEGQEEDGLDSPNGEDSSQNEDPSGSQGRLAEIDAEPFPGKEADGRYALGAESRSAQTVTASYSAMSAQNDADFQVIQSELAYLQSSLSEKTSQYNTYLTSIEEKKAAEAAEIARRLALRGNIVKSALQYVGNPYVYGGNDPNTGVDCSGFTRYILGHVAGVYLNRTAASQSTQGQAVSEEEARPGDLVFYSGGGSINHVAIYIGDGRVVHASNERIGITTSNMHYRTPVKIVNVLGD